jgi:sulfate adenylyltransferase subunit 1 (EFTu-like GTPase family)
VSEIALLAPASRAPARLSSRFVADLVWLKEEPSRPGDRFWLRLGTRIVLARIRKLERVLEPGGTRWREPALGEATLAPNSIARVEIETQQPLAIERCGTIEAGGAFLLVDEASERPVADGTIRCEPEPATD